MIVSSTLQGLRQHSEEWITLPQAGGCTVLLQIQAMHYELYELYNLVQYLFSFFKVREKKCYSKLFLEAYETIYDATHFKFDNIPNILRRFNNDKLKRYKDEKKTNSAVLSNQYLYHTTINIYITILNAILHGNYIFLTSDNIGQSGKYFCRNTNLTPVLTQNG